MSSDHENNDEKHSIEIELTRSKCNHQKRLIHALWAFAFLVLFQCISMTWNTSTDFRNIWQTKKHLHAEDSFDVLPTALLDAVYSPSDFRNDYGVIPPFWNEAAFKFLNCSNNETQLNQTSAPCSKDSNNTNMQSKAQRNIITIGPCYRPERRINWKESIRSQNEKKIITYPLRRPYKPGLYKPNAVPNGMCLPGFLIIGAGKCGTSSLYQYLVGHPRVLPAKKKQVHYFKYYTGRPFEWYLSFFASTVSFLTSGALMTGEAAPGYLPYPDVAKRVTKVMAPMGLPKIILIARNPLERAYSSYRYNYLEPAIKRLKIGYIENQTFSFEDLMKAELSALKECLKPGGYAEIQTKRLHSKWASEEFQKREENGLPPMMDLEEFCYNEKSQWAELIRSHPDHILFDLKNLHLVRSFIGRGLYGLSLEWWYMFFPETDIHIVCSEDLRKNASEVMDKLVAFLGLPSYNFTSIISKGMFNVGGHRGYNRATPWEDAVKDSEMIPLSYDFLQELNDFFHGYNERFFNVTSKRCDW